jgi:rod shape-determining protein MreC
MKFIYTKAFLIFAATLVLIVIVLFLQNKGYLDRVRTFLLQAPRPVVGAAKSVALPVKNFFGTLYNLNDLVEKNSDLEIQLQQAHEKLVLLQEYQNQNEILKNELGFKNKSSNTLVPCTVLIVDPEGLTDAIVLNCGSKVGVRLGQAVVAQNHLVGKIAYVGDDTSTAILITSPQANIDSRVIKTGELGLVSGSFNSGVVIDRLSQNAPLDKTDLVVTAGINSLIPKNIVIGQIGDTISRQTDLFKKATVVSPVQFNNLEFVFVVQ